jgi:ankyrin repeat protein
VEHSNLKLFNAHTKDYPFNELIASPGKTAAPLIFHIFVHEFEAGLKLIAKNCDITAKDEEGHGIGMYLLRSDNFETLFKLINQYFPGKLQSILSEAREGVSLFEIAAKVGKESFLEYALLAISNPMAVIDSKGNTFLHQVVSANNLKILKMFLKLKGLDVNVGNYQNRRPLMIAAASGNVLIVKELLANGADPNLLDNDQRNSLFYGLLSDKNQQIAETLLPLTFDINQTDRVGATVAILAARQKKSTTLNSILCRNPDLTKRMKAGYQAVHCAAEEGSFENLVSLIQSGADVNSPVRREHPKEKKSSLDTPLHLAARKGNFKAFNLLFNLGADVKAENAAEETPIEAAIRNKHPAIMTTV